MQTLTFDHGIELRELDQGLLVRQHGDAYVAREWRLTQAVVELIETAIKSGLTSMIRKDHPRSNSRWPNPRGTVYLAFSISPQVQWSVAIDSWREKSRDFGPAVFNGKYLSQFRAAGVPFVFEGRNRVAGHLVVGRETVLQTIRHLKAFDHTALELGRSDTPRTGFATEYDIQRSLLEAWDVSPFGPAYNVVQDEYPIDGGLTSRRIDILARGRRTKDWLVIELKRAEASLDAIRQLDGYLETLACKDGFSDHPSVGALVAERIPDHVRREAAARGIMAFEATWPADFNRVYYDQDECEWLAGGFEVIIGGRYYCVDITRKHLVIFRR